MKILFFVHSEHKYIFYQPFLKIEKTSQAEGSVETYRHELFDAKSCIFELMSMFGIKCSMAMLSTPPLTHSRRHVLGLTPQTVVKSRYTRSASVKLPSGPVEAQRRGTPLTHFPAIPEVNPFKCCKQNMDAAIWRRISTAKGKPQRMLDSVSPLSL